MSKQKQIEEYLRTGYSLSGTQALAKFGVYRLSSVIHRMRQRGFEIVTVPKGKEGYAVYKVKCNCCGITGRPTYRVFGHYVCNHCSETIKERNDESDFI